MKKYKYVIDGKTLRGSIVRAKNLCEYINKISDQVLGITGEHAVGNIAGDLWDSEEVQGIRNGKLHQILEA